MAPMPRRCLGLLFALVLTFPARASAQSTLPGRSLFSAVDVWREQQRWLPAWLDDEDWKTWAWHGAITEGAGYALSRVTPMSFRRGRQVLAGFYVARELYNIAAERNHKYGDASMDALVPLLVAVSAFRVEVRF